MGRGGRIAASFWLAAAAVSCVAPTGEEDPAGPLDPLPLDLTVDRLDLIHGAVRLSATMEDGSADVAVLLGDACDRREVGRGMATRSTLVWALAESEIAEAFACDLVVRARVRTQAGLVVKELSLAVSPVVSASGVDDGPQLGDASPTGEGIQFTFTAVPRWARLSVGDSLVERAVHGPPDEEEPAADEGTVFVATHLDFARTVFTRRPVVLAGAAFDASLAIGGMALGDEQGAAE